jgi:hypothetical protein
MPKARQRSTIAENRRRRRFQSAEDRPLRRGAPLDDQSCLVIVEVYGSSTEKTKHNRTPYYQTWRDTVAEMMAEPRSAIKCDNVFPGDEGRRCGSFDTV